MASNIPISKANIVTLIDRETVYGVANVTPESKQIAYDALGLARKQTLEANNELRGTRRIGTLVPGDKNPGGALTGHMTDITLPLFLEAMLGLRVTTEIGGAGVTVTAALASPAVAGNINNGTHSYKVVVNKTGGLTLPSAASNIVTVVDLSVNGKILVTRTGGALPTGWTWDVFRTVAGNAAPWKLVNPAPIGAAVLTYLDNIADGSLTTSAPSASTGGAGDFQHVITVGTGLPSFTIERHHAYNDATDDFILALGAMCNRGTIAMKATGYYDISADYLCQSVSTQATSFEAGSPLDWRGGEKIHHAMVTAGKVKMGLTGGSLADFAKIMTMSFEHNNNLDTTDRPMGLTGDRGSSVPLQAISTISGTLKISDKDALALLQDPTTLKTLTVEHDFATFGHKVLAEFIACQFDPMDAEVSGQGILTANFTAHAVEDPVTVEQVRFTVVNSIASSFYDPV